MDRLRIRWTIVAALSICFAGLTTATASAAGLPAQGLYEECDPVYQQQCASELAQMGGAGFQLALNYSAWYGNPAQIQAYASEAQADGVKLIWPLNYSAWRDAGSATTLLSTYTKLTPYCGCTDNAGFLAYAINLVRSSPATWGYYIGDELDPSQAPAVAALAAAVRQLDPGHPLLYVGDITANLPPFESTANVVGADTYPIGTVGGSVSTVGPVASAVQQLSHTYGTLPVMVLQAFSWTEYPGDVPTLDPTFPTESQMQEMRDEALAANPSMILWYSIYDVLRSDNPTGHWQDLVQAAFAPLPTVQPGTVATPQPSPALDPPTVRTISRRARAVARIASIPPRHHRRRHRRHRHRHHHRTRHHRSTHHRRKRQPQQPNPRLIIGLALDSLLLF